MKKIVTISLALLIALAAPAYAQGLSLKTASGGDIGLQISSYKYEEDLNNSFLMSLEGKKVGAIGSFTQAYDNNWYWGIDGRFVTGNVDYTSASTGDKSANPDSYLEVRLTAGKDFEVGSQLLSPYAGLGYRYLNNDLRGSSTTGHAGYRRTSNYTYIPLGVTHRFRVSQEARFSTTFEYDYLLQGIQRSYMTDVTAAGYTTDLNNLQRSGHGLRLNLAYETADWSAGVFYHYWNIADSDVSVYTDASFVHSGIEPHNITREVGVQVKYRFR